MRVVRATVVLAIVFLVSGLLAADVTVVQRTQGTGLAAAGSGTTTTYVKGLKMRAESSVGGKLTVTIFDVEGGEMLLLEPDKKRGEAFGVATMRETAGIALGDIDVHFEPTGEHRTVAGMECDGYESRIAVTATGPDGSAFDTIVGGPVCLAPDAPGKSDWAKFYSSAVERGFFFQRPDAAKAQPGQARGMAELQRAIAEKGLPLESEMTISFEGSGMMAAILSKMSFSMTSTVESISTQGLDDSLFSAPSGFKIKRN